MGAVSLPEIESDSVHFSKRMKVCRKTMETMSDEAEHSGNESLPLLSQEDDSKDIPSESQEDYMSSKLGELATKSLDAEEYTEEASRPNIEQINHSGETSETEVLERKGSLNLQSILSRKTLDDIWKDIQHRLNEGVLGVDEEVPDNMVGGMTLEDFLVKVGVVKEDVSTSNDQTVNLYRGIYNEEFIQMHHDHGNMQDIGGHEATLDIDLMSQKTEHDFKDNIISGGGGVSKARMRLQEIARHEARKRATIASSNSSVQDGLEGNLCGDWADTSGAGFYMCQMVPGGSVNAISSGHEMLMDHAQAPRRGAEKDVIGVADPRQRRMIRNRESAARSRARKQAYTAELEKEVETLKEENARLRRQEVERAFEWNLKIMNHLLSDVSMPGTRMLRRSQTNPW